MTLDEAKKHNAVLNDRPIDHQKTSGPLAGMEEIEVALINKAVAIMKKTPALNESGASQRKAWANGFYNGFIFFKGIIDDNIDSLQEYLNEEFNATHDDNYRAQVEITKLVKEISNKAHR